MRVWIRGAIVLVLFLAALPFVMLTAMGDMKPAEGFCLEHGLWARDGDAPTPEEAAASYFISPELAARERWYNDWFSWPVCIRSRRGEHRFWARYHNRNLQRLAEPNLSRLHEDDPGARVLRVLTAPSFSRDQIAIRLLMRTDGAATVEAQWLVDDHPDPPGGGSPEAYQSWESEVLPRAGSEGALSRQAAAEIWDLARQSHRREYWNWATMDGNWLVVEIIDTGRREVKFLLLEATSTSDALFCRLAEAARVPTEALEEGDVAQACAPESQGG
jgi:hypothetical protein